MATVNGVVTDVSQDGSVRKIVWSPLTTTNSDGAPAQWCEYMDRCIQFHGTFGAAGTIVLQGSNDGSNWFTLNDVQATAISKTAAAIEQVTELPLYVRPLVTGGDGTTSLTATLIMRRGNPVGR